MSWSHPTCTTRAFSAGRVGWQNRRGLERRRSREVRSLTSQVSWSTRRPTAAERGPVDEITGRANASIGRGQRDPGRAGARVGPGEHAGDLPVTPEIRSLDESSPPADGPPQMAGVARAWEAAASDARTECVITLRSGIVLDNDTPALDRLLSRARWGLGGRVGSGTQWVSWITSRTGSPSFASPFSPYARSCPGSFTQRARHLYRNVNLMAALRRSVHRPAAPPTPKVLVGLGAVMLRTDPALALTGRPVVPDRLLNAGFDFRHPDIDEALPT